MQIVIDIDDGKLWQIKNEPIKKNFNIYELASYIDKGIPLPKGHDRLIDVKQIVTKDECIWNSDGSCTTITTYDIDSTQTIIEADKEND